MTNCYRKNNTKYCDFSHTKAVFSVKSANFGSFCKPRLNFNGNTFIFLIKLSKSQQNYCDFSHKKIKGVQNVKSIQF